MAHATSTAIGLRLLLPGLLGLGLAAACDGSDTEGLAALPAELEISAEALDFGRTLVGSAGVERELTFRNPGGGALVLQISLTPGSASQGFNGALPDDGRLLLRPGSEETLLLRFTAVEAGEAAGALYLTTDDPRWPELLIPLAGFGTTHALCTSHRSIDFGEVLVGERAFRRILFGNCASSPILVSFRALGADQTTPFSLPQPANEEALWLRVEDVQLDPGDEFRVDVMYEPGRGGPHSANLVVGTRMVDPPQSLPASRIAIAGRGIGARACTTRRFATDFGEVGLDDSRNHRLYMENCGELPLELSARLVSPVSMDIPFNVWPSQLNLEPGEEGHMEVSFAPFSPGFHYADLVLLEFGPGGAMARRPIVHSLSGFGIGGRMCTSTNSMWFEARPPDWTDTQTVQFRNCGFQDFSVTDFELEFWDGDARAFQLRRVPRTPFRLAPGEVRELDVRYSAVAGDGPTDARLHISANTDPPVLSVWLQGQLAREP